MDLYRFTPPQPCQSRIAQKYKILILKYLIVNDLSHCLKSKQIKRLDQANPVRALARMVDDEFGASDSSKYDEIHVDGKVYSSRDREGTKKYTSKVYAKGAGSRKVND